MIGQKPVTTPFDGLLPLPPEQQDRKTDEGLFDYRPYNKLQLLIKSISHEDRVKHLNIMRYTTNS